MDVVKPRARAKPVLKLAALIAILLIAVVGTLLAFTHVESHDDFVAKNSVVIDTARRSNLQRSITAPGTLVARHISLITAQSDGLVQQILVSAGTHVNERTPVFLLRSATAEQAVATARGQLEAARVGLRAITQHNRSALLQVQAEARNLTSQADLAATDESSDKKLIASGLIAEQTFRIAEIKASATADQLRIAQSRIKSEDAEGDAKVAEQMAVIEQLQTALQQRLLDKLQLTVLAPTSGIIQSIGVQIGQHLSTGAELARVADERDFEAQLDVAEADTSEIRSGDAVLVRESGRAVQGTVTRVDPAAKDGTVAVEVHLLSRPANWLLGSHIDGNIVLENLGNVVSIARPVGASNNTNVELYKLVGQESAIRILVQLGSGSVDRVAVKAGLQAGDSVIISDAGAFRSRRVVLQ